MKEHFTVPGGKSPYTFSGHPQKDEIAVASVASSRLPTRETIKTTRRGPDCFGHTRSRWTTTTAVASCTGAGNDTAPTVPRDDGRVHEGDSQRRRWRRLQNATGERIQLQS